MVFTVLKAWKKRKHVDDYGNIHCAKSVCIGSYFGPYFPVFPGKKRARITPNTDYFYPVILNFIDLILLVGQLPCKIWMLLKLDHPSSYEILLDPLWSNFKKWAKNCNVKLSKTVSRSKLKSFNENSNETLLNPSVLIVMNEALVKNFFEGS